ncbi:MAG: pyrimidine 5'-nucleotidase [Anaerolineales bacterium]|nr:pyrimidine 5'-nucleotidase [Anaerolineales bacterium]
MIKTIFFDLDDTLYPKDSGVWQALRGRIAQYMHEVVGIPEADVPTVREHYLKTYGTSLRGLQHHHAIDAEAYLRYTHELPIETLIAPNPALDAMLSQLPQTKYIFTNSASFHAERVLRALGVERHFAEIIDVRKMEFRSKPDLFAYQLAFERSQTAPGETLFVDDMPANLAPAKRLGALTALIGEPEDGTAVADVSLAQVERLTEAMPALVEFAHG